MFNFLANILHKVWKPQTPSKQTDVQSQSTVTTLYELFKEHLSGIEATSSDTKPEVDGAYHMANCYSARLDDDILESVKKVAHIHLGGHRLSTRDRTTSLEFLSRLRCVDSLSDYLILALQAITDNKHYTLESWTPPDVRVIGSETGFQGGVEVQSKTGVYLVHLSDLIAHSTLNLDIPARKFGLGESEGPGDNSEPSPHLPPYCFVSHAWVDKEMADTKDGKFYRCFLLVALSIYLDTGIEYFWVDYICVTQDPTKKNLKAEQLHQIPSVIQHASIYVSLCLEIYQYYSSAWCALETLLFLGKNPRCHPFDFLSNLRRTTYHFGMNVVDPTKVNANEKIIYSFTDQPFSCGDPTDLQFLDTEIKRAKLEAMMRVWRLASRIIKTSVGLSRVDDLGVLITGPILSYLQQSLFDGGFETATYVLGQISTTLTECGISPIPDSRKEELSSVLERCGELYRVIGYIGELWPGVRLRSGGSYDV